MWEAIAGLLSIAVIILKFYFQERQKRSIRTYEGDVAEIDKAIATRDADTISRLFYELRIPKGDNTSDSSRQNGQGTP